MKYEKILFVKFEPSEYELFKKVVAYLPKDPPDLETLDKGGYIYTSLDLVAEHLTEDKELKALFKQILELYPESYNYICFVKEE